MQNLKAYHIYETIENKKYLNLGKYNRHSLDSEGKLIEKRAKNVILPITDDHYVLLSQGTNLNDIIYDILGHTILESGNRNYREILSESNRLLGNFGVAPELTEELFSILELSDADLLNSRNFKEIVENLSTQTLSAIVRETPLHKECYTNFNFLTVSELANYHASEIVKQTLILFYQNTHLLFRHIEDSNISTKTIVDTLKGEDTGFKITYFLNKENHEFEIYLQKIEDESNYENKYRTFLKENLVRFKSTHLRNSQSIVTLGEEDLENAFYFHIQEVLSKFNVTNK